MLRAALALLLIANALYFAYGQGWLAPVGLVPSVTTEPERMAQQIRPEAIQLQDPDKRGRKDQRPASPSAAAAACLRSALIESERMVKVREQLAARLGEGSYTVEEASTPARWIVYMGKYADTEALNRKKAELRNRGVSFEPTNNGSLEPGLTLAVLSTREEANRRLEALSQRGVRTARVLEERAAVRGFVVRLPAVDDAQRAKLADLQDIGLAPCAP